MKKHAKPEMIDENPEWTAADFKRAMPIQALPTTMQRKLRGRPKSEAPKVAVKVRLDPDLLAVLRATGDGWQTRVNRILRERFAL